MNTKKHKNKSKQNKPQNTNKTGVTSVEEEKVEEKAIEDECVVRSDERVPEIVSEVVSQAAPTKEEGDTPKKPKRNRGKKKKNEKDDGFDDEDDKKTQASSEKNTIADETTCDPENAPKAQSANVEAAPHSRKKKNKNKNTSEQPTETPMKFEIVADHPLKVTRLTKSEAEDIMSDVKMITCVPIPGEGSEQDSKKKKNKKKKRTDSEKSDKEDFVSCTSAFQKILEPRDDKKDNKKVDEKPIKEDIESLMEDRSMIDVPENVTLDMILKSESDTKTEKIKDSVPEIAQDGKGKKKNKKDKKIPTKSESEDDCINTPEPKLEISEKPLAKPDNIKIEVAHDILPAPSSDKNESVEMLKSEESQSPKPKAKIAKPIERKNKDIKPETLSEIITEPDNCPKSKAIGEKPTFEEMIKLPGTDETKQESKMGSNIKAQVIIEEKEEVKEQAKTLENIQVVSIIPEKKRQKSPKPQRVEDLKNEDKLFKIAPVEKKDETQKEQKTENPVSLVQACITESKDPSKAIPFSETVLPPIQILNVEGTIQEPILEKTENKEVKDEKNSKVLERERFEKISMPDGGMGKKRKKSPKPQRKFDVDIDKAKEDTSDHIEKIPTEEFIIKTESIPQPSPADFKMLKSDNVLKETQQKDTKKDEQTLKKDEKELKSNIKPKSEVKPESSLKDLEISIVKTEESDVSVCDIAPLVDYPRSSSQSADGNNNMAIREISANDDNPGSVLLRRLASPLPMIKSSGETPLPKKTLQKDEKGQSMEDKKETCQKDGEKQKKVQADVQKTDLKSKMMEVNQDMEGLRKSIEKSLAELSVMEKSEKSTEQQFVEAQSKLQQIKDLALKQQSNVNDQAASSGKQDEIKSLNIEPPQSMPPTMKSMTFHSKPQTNIVAPITLPMKEPERTELNPIDVIQSTDTPKTPETPARRDNKGKGKSKKKGKSETEPAMTQKSTTSATGAVTDSKDTKTSTQEAKKEDKTEQKGQSQEKTKQQDASFCKDTSSEEVFSAKESETDFDQIVNFEDALTSSVENVNRSFEMIVNDQSDTNNPEINITAPVEDEKDTKDKQSKSNPVSQPKNLLGHPSIPARSNRMDYKKEKNKTPNSQQAKVKIKDFESIEKQKASKDTQTESKQKIIREKSTKNTSLSDDNEEYVYKYSFRKVYLPNACHVCKIELKEGRTPCSFCNLVFYCSLKHKDEDYAQHQTLCFAVSTIIKLKDQKHIYENTANITGHDYRLLRMQMIVSCEKVLQRRLVPCEQEMLLYPRICADPGCREWRQDKLVDCDICGQISYCSSNPRHLPTTHQRWCKSYALYQKLVCYQQTKGRLDPKLPTRVMKGSYRIPDKMNEVLASLYEEKIDMSDIQYAALTQVATAPLTTAYFHQLYSDQKNANHANGMHKKSTFTIHVVGAELQFEADVLIKWEVFFLHVRPDVAELRVVLIGADLNPGQLPLDLLGKIKLCEDCRNNKRRVVFDFQDKRSYSEYWSSDFITPDLVCAFNPSIQRSSAFNGKDPWPSTIKCVFKQRVPFIITSYTLNELHRDLKRIKECSDLGLELVSEPSLNGFASVRPDRNFISDDEMPLLFKNYCSMVVCGAF